MKLSTLKGQQKVFGTLKLTIKNPEGAIALFKQGTWKDGIRRLFGASLSNELLNALQTASITDIARIERFVATSNTFASRLVQRGVRIVDGDVLTQRLLNLWTDAKNIDVLSVKPSFAGFLDDAEHAIRELHRVNFMDAYFNEMLQTADKFKAGAVGLDILRTRPTYLKGMTLTGIEDNIAAYGGNFRYDLKFVNASRTKTYYIDTKNYSSIYQIFKGENLNQLKAYFKERENIDELFIVIKNRSGFPQDALKSAKGQLQNGLKTDPGGFYNQNRAMFNKMNQLNSSSPVTNQAHFEAIVNSSATDFANHPISNIVKIQD